MRAYGSVGLSFWGAEDALAAGQTRGLSAAKKEKSSRQKEDRRTSGRACRNLRVVTVFGLHFFVLFHVAGLDRLQLQRAGRHHLEVGATLGARDDLALVDLFLFHIQISFAFRTKNHDSSAPIRCHVLRYACLDTLDNI